MLIAIDAGHYLGTPGKRCLRAIDPGETREWVLNGRVADKVQERLAAYDCQTMRVDDPTGRTEIDLFDRVLAANLAGADVYLSIHHNAGIKGGPGGGIVVYVCPGVGEDTTRLQRAVYEHTVASTGLRGNRSRPLAVADYYVLVNTKMPAVLGEFGFMDSTTDTPIILTEEYADKLVDGIVKALVDLYDLQPLVVGETEYQLTKGFHDFAVPVGLFSVEAVDTDKMSVAKNITNAGYFGRYSEGGEKFTLPAGPIVADMVTDSKWANHYAEERKWLDGDKIRYNSYQWEYKNPFYQKEVSALVVSDGKAAIKEISDLPDCDYLLSGVPIIRDGKQVSQAKATSQGWDKSSLRATHHIFVGLKGDGTIHVLGGETTTDDLISEAAAKLLPLGYTDVIKLDGGGSYEINTDVVRAEDSENRRIFSIIRMKGEVVMSGNNTFQDDGYAQWKHYMEQYLNERAALPASDWAKPYIQDAIDAGAMTDVGGTIERPQGFITRQEMAVVAAALSKK